MGKLIWLFHFLFCFFKYQVASSSSLCLFDESSALLQFKQMFTIDSSASSWCDQKGSPSYSKTMSWNETTTATDCCLWDGVTCDGSTGHVIGLDLSCSKLYGTIHPNSTLFQLSHLQHLNLAFNHFNFSPLSPAFGRFTSLSHLNLSFSFLSGSIPSEISHLSKLVSLDLSSVRGILRLEPHNFETLLMNLTQLQNLILLQVNISSGLPKSLLNLSSLATLDLTATRLLGNLPYEIFHLPKLRELYVRGNYNLTGNLLMVNWSSNSSLEELALTDTLMSGKLPDSIGHLRFSNYLDLSRNEFSGPLPESLGNLTRMTRLYLSGNSFNGQVPSTLSNLKQLTEIRFGLNNLNGEIPEFFAKFIKLEYLKLGANNFTGQFPSWIANLSQLVYLDISDNALTGPIPSNLSGFQNLQVLYLSNSSLNGTLPSWLFTIPSLQELDLRSNEFTGQIHEFRRDSPLTYIDLNYNKLHGSIPRSISSLVNLSTLFLSSNNLSGVVELQKFSNLRNLDLSENNFLVNIGSNAKATWPNLVSLRLSSCNVSEFPNFVRNSKNVRVLHLSNNGIHGEIPKWVEGSSLSSLDLSSNNLQGPLLVPSPSVFYLSISHNKLTGDIPSSVCNLSSLQILVLSNNKLDGVIPSCLGNVSNVLSVLDLRMNGFYGPIPTTFSNGNKLRSLNLNGNHLEGTVPRSLANCKSMELLDLGNNNLNGTFPHWLESLPELQVLVLKSNRFHGPIASSRTEIPFPKLRIFDLSHNKFTGILPEKYFLNFESMMNVDETKTELEYMGDSSYRDSVELVLKGVVIELQYILTIFTTIDFSYNNFTGEILNDIGKLQELRLLNLSYNSLSGQIPSLLRNITMLESLDLSSNQLVGEIPGELTSLTFLAVLNLSKNHLVGPIPRGKQFDTFQNDSYVGNSGLCGLPLSKTCGGSEAQPPPPPPILEDDDDDFASGFTWRIVLLGYGCGMVVGITMGFLMFLIGRPRWFVRIVGGEPHSRVIRLNQLIWRSHQC